MKTTFRIFYVSCATLATFFVGMEQVQAGVKAIYLSGWQVAADANSAGQMYPDQSLYPADSVPGVVRRINNAFQRADQIQQSEGGAGAKTHWFASCPRTRDARNSVKTLFRRIAVSFTSS